MKVGIMQPYFFPYIGYWQLMNAVDRYVVYDNIQYSKRGWINRNRILVNGEAKMVTLPLKKDSDYLDIRDRFLSDTIDQDLKRMLNQIQNAYRRAPYFEDVYPLVKKCLTYEDRNLFRFLYHSIRSVADYLGIKTEILVSSEIESTTGLKSEERVLSTCNDLGATVYLNAIGGMELYDRERFSANGITISFLDDRSMPYAQFKDPFVSRLSIIDVMMFNDREQINRMLDEYVLL